MKLRALPALALILATSANAAEKPNDAFLKKAIQGNYAEVEMGKLAQQNGQSDSLRNYGQMLQADHAAANEKAIAAAKSMGVTPPDGPNDKQRADYEKMSKMSGSQFDRSFATHMVADHRKDIAEYKTAAKKSDAAAEYAKASIPVLQKHLEAAKSLGSKKASSK